MFKHKFEDVIQKNTINSYIAKHGNKSGIAIVLDGADASTTKHLINATWDRSKIHVPNNSIDYHKIKQKIGGMCNVYPITLKTLLERLQTRRVAPNRFSSNSEVFGTPLIGLIYMDYMCTLTGNQSVNPIEDLETLFHNKMLLSNSTLAITLSLRGHTKNDTGFVNTPQKMISIITSLAYENGYNCVVEPIGGVYKNGGPMWTGIFTLIGD